MTALHLFLFAYFLQSYKKHVQNGKLITGITRHRIQ